MKNNECEVNEFMDLPDDPEAAFAVLQRRKYKDLEDSWGNNGSGWYTERRYVDTLNAFDEVHNLGILLSYRKPPTKDVQFSDFFQEFRRAAEIASQKIMMESARRTKATSQFIVVLDASTRLAIHKLIAAIREKLDSLEISDQKREALFDKLNAFAAEVDRDRTRTEAFFAFAVDASRAFREVSDNVNPLTKTIDRVNDLIDKATKWVESLPKWQDRRQIPGPAKQLPKPKEPEWADEEIPF